MKLGQNVWNRSPAADAKNGRQSNAEGNDEPISILLRERFSPLILHIKTSNKVNASRINPDTGAKNEETTFTQSNLTRIGEFS